MSTFKTIKNNKPVSDSIVKSYLKNPKFGERCTDYMAHIHYQNGKWTNHEIIPYQNLSLPPSTSVFHYGQEIFEGLKAYKWANGVAHVFRPGENAERFQKSATRVALPPLPVNDFVDAITKALSLDQRWIPTGENMSLYIRPFMIATEAFIGLRAAEVADFYVIFSPVGAYVEGVAKIWLETKYFRATPGGTGAAKCGGNYAASLLAKMLAHEKGCTDSLYLDAKTAKYIEEFSGMSFFAVQSDGTLISPKISDTILDSITRKSIIQIAKDNKIKFVEKDIDYKKLLADIKSKKIAEVFACGTAAVVSPVGVIKGEGFEVTVGDGKFGKISKFLKEELVGIQRGEKPDKHKWMVAVK